MIGISFSLPSTVDFAHTLQIAIGRKNDNDVWVVDCLWIEGPVAMSHNEDMVFTSNELIAYFSSIPRQNFVFFARLRRYNSRNEIDETETWDDYLSSGCSATIFITDAYVWEIYNKSACELEKIESGIAKTETNYIDCYDQENMPCTLMWV